MSALLTEEEHRAMELTADLARSIAAVIGDGGAPAAADLKEAVAHIHALQHMIMAQAAARTYPDRYRLLGHLT